MSRPLDSVALSTDQASELRALLEELTLHHEHMLTLLSQHRAAISRADGTALDACITAQQEAAIRLSDLDSRRLRLVREVWHGGNPAAARRGAVAPTPALTLSFLASRAAEPARTGLLAAAKRLKEAMNAVAGKQRAVRMASDSLLGHMQGLIAQVARSLSQTGTYTRPGQQDAAPVISALDMTS